MTAGSGVRADDAAPSFRRPRPCRWAVVHVWTSGNRGLGREALTVLRSGRCRPVVHTWRRLMARFVGLDVSQKLSSVCVVDDIGRRVWRGQCSTDPGQIARVVKAHAGDDARVGIETGPMRPWLVRELRRRGLDTACLDARHASAALKFPRAARGMAAEGGRSDRATTRAPRAEAAIAR